MKRLSKVSESSTKYSESRSSVCSDFDTDNNYSK